ncbi:MAG: hypothetical protein AAB855_02550, partial [Patescibacteria group bacterium]
VAYAETLAASPGTTIVQDLLSGTTLDRSIILMRENVESPARISVEMGGNAKDALYGPRELLIPQGEERASYSFTIDGSKLPSGKGPHTADITFSFDSFANADQPGIALAVRASISITVTDTKKPILTIGQAYFGRAFDATPLVLIYDAENTGNIPSAPARAEITLTSPINNGQWHETIPAERFSATDQFSTSQGILTTNMAMASGFYSAAIILYDTSDNILYTRTDYPLQVDKSNGSPPGHSVRLFEFLPISFLLAIMIIGSVYAIYFAKKSR